MTDFSRLSMEEVAARLRGGVETLILLHRRPDGDAVGSALALSLLLGEMGCTVRFASEDEWPTRLRFLLDDPDLGRLPGAEFGLCFGALRPSYAPAQIIAVDVASPAQLGTMRELYADRVTLMIDHHAKGEMLADGWIDPTAAATGQMIHALACELLRTGRILTIPAAAARLMYAALSADTGCFRYANADAAAHRVAADLLEFGFDAADINYRLFTVKSIETMTAERLAFDRMRLFAGGRVGIVDMPASLAWENGLTDEHFGTLVDAPRSLAGVEVAVAIRQTDDGSTYRVSMRATGTADVSAVCAAFGGGGHTKAAGCTITSDRGMEAVIAMVAEALTIALDA